MLHESLLPDPPPARSATPDRVELSLLRAENKSLREKLGRIEASMAAWAADLDKAQAESQALRSTIDEMRDHVRDAQSERDRVRADANALRAAIELRDVHIADLESRIVTGDMERLDQKRTRARLVALRRRIRARLVRQGATIAALRRELEGADATRRRAESESLTRATDLRRNERYLDRLERRLAEAERRSIEGD